MNDEYPVDHKMQIESRTFEYSDLLALRAVADNPLTLLPSYVSMRLLNWGAIRHEDIKDHTGATVFIGLYITEIGVRVLDIADRTGHSFVSIPIPPAYPPPSW